MGFLYGFMVNDSSFIGDKILLLCRRGAIGVIFGELSGDCNGEFLREWFWKVTIRWDGLTTEYW